MKITLRPEGATDNSADVVLADGADRADDNVRGPASGSISVSMAVQEIKAIRAENARFVSRKNRSGSYSFKASRRFASLPDADGFMLTHGMSCPSSGTLIFDWGLNYTIHLGGCVIRQIGEMSQIGCHVTASYSVNYSTATVVPTDSILVNCGGPALTGWITDDGLYTGSGGTASTDHAITGATEAPADLYKTLRWGTALVYTFPVADGLYQLNFHLVETAYNNTGERVFRILVNGTVSHDNVDILAALSGTKFMAGVWRKYNAVASGGTGLTVSFVNITGGAMCCGIEVIATPTTQSRAITPPADTRISKKINCGGWADTGDWLPDEGYSDGTAPRYSEAAIVSAGDVPQPVYQTSREGETIVYSIDLPSGLYNLRLHFSELVHEESAARLFDIDVNGTTHSEDFDIFDQSDAKDTAAVVDIAEIEVTDTLTITLTASTGLACISGIEITPTPPEEEE